MRLEFLPLGDCGVRMKFGSEISPATNARIRRFGAALDAAPIDGMTEWVCGYAVVTIYYHPWIIGYEEICKALRQRLRRPSASEAALAEAALAEAALAEAALAEATSAEATSAEATSAEATSAEATSAEAGSVERVVEIPVCYGGDFGPDLEEVAAWHRLTARQVTQRHSRPLYRVYFLGFLPGFAYLGGLPRSLETPRRPSPRSSVPAGSVGLAGRQTGVYPLATPAGWQIIGRTPLRLYDPRREAPALLSAGNQVKFVPVDADQYRELEKAELGKAELEKTNALG